MKNFSGVFKFLVLLSHITCVSESGTILGELFNILLFVSSIVSKLLINGEKIHFAHSELCSEPQHEIAISNEIQ